MAKLRRSEIVPDPLSRDLGGRIRLDMLRDAAWNSRC
jgi:hypothetical protein